MPSNFFTSELPTAMIANPSAFTALNTVLRYVSVGAGDWTLFLKGPTPEVRSYVAEADDTEIKATITLDQSLFTEARSSATAALRMFLDKRMTVSGEITDRKEAVKLRRVFELVPPT